MVSTYSAVVGAILCDLTKDSVDCDGRAASVCLGGDGGIQVGTVLAAVLDGCLLVAEHVVVVGAALATVCV